MHQLSATRATLHGHWSRELPPALAIDAGDTVRFSCLDAMWCDGRPDRPWPWRRFEPRNPDLDQGHALTGPVFVRGARPGMTLEIAIGEIVPDDWGWTWSWPQGERAAELGLAGAPHYMQVWDVDPARMLARDGEGRSFALRPFMGVMGVAPAEAGVHATTPPRVWGGNIDCKELVAGTTLYLPIGVEGALFSVGDGHGLQGDGEVCGTAIECPMTRVDLTFNVIDRPLKAPRTKTADAWITFGFDPDLNRASLMALNGMLDLIMEEFGDGGRMDRSKALGLASLAADLRVTQIVNQSQGVHCFLPFDALATR
jgi:acetamidase/formamidase